jgi:hypothetical protein
MMNVCLHKINNFLDIIRRPNLYLKLHFRGWNLFPPPGQAPKLLITVNITSSYFRTNGWTVKQIDEYVSMKWMKGG